jgi:hypothetical protein
LYYAVSTLHEFISPLAQAVVHREIPADAYLLKVEHWREISHPTPATDLLPWEDATALRVTELG